MLMVSDLLELALGRSDASSVRTRTPGRYDRDGDTPAVPVVVWNICRHCNMTCPHCYIAAGTAPSPSQADTAHALDIIDRLADGGVRVLIFSGGEPLLREDIFTLIHHARSRGMSTHLSTNGTLIDEAKATDLADAGIGYVGISIDGTEAFNDEWRGLAGGYQLAVAGLRNARAAGMRTGLRITVTRRNEPHVPVLLDLARELDCARFYVSHLVYAGRAHALIEQDLPPEAARASLHRLFRLALDDLQSEGSPTTRVVTGGNDSDGPALMAWIREQLGADAVNPVASMLDSRRGNSAGEGILCVDHRGAVFPDQFWRTEKLGDLRRQTLDEVRAHPLLAELRAREQHLQGRCGACQFRAICRGSHRERSLAARGSLWGPDPACVMTDSEIAIPSLSTTSQP